MVCDLFLPIIITVIVVIIVISLSAQKQKLVPAPKGMRHRATPLSLTRGDKRGDSQKVTAFCIWTLGMLNINLCLLSLKKKNPTCLTCMKFSLSHMNP